MKRLAASSAPRTGSKRAPTELSGGLLVAEAMGAYDYLPRALVRSSVPGALSVNSRGRGKRFAEQRAAWIEDALDEFGFLLAMLYGAKVVVDKDGRYECHIDGLRATGDKWNEAVVRTSLLKLETDREKS